MITTGLMGGLGNYMFQIATAESIARDLHTNAVFDLSRVGQSQRHITNYTTNLFRNVKFGTPLPKYIYNERKFSYDEIPAADDLYLSGYFQSEKYFSRYSNEIKDLFLPKEDVDRLKKVIKQFEFVCSIHIRRGDYLKYPNKHTQPSVNYFLNAVNEIKIENPNAIFFVFSDDIRWCKNVFIGSEFRFIEQFEDWEDLILMSLCDANIITNSTFSWWSAWLGETPEKTIIAPEKWFGPDGPSDQQDIIPERWKRLK